MAELRNEIFVGGGEGEQVRRKKRTACCDAGGASGFNWSGVGRGADTTAGERDGEGDFISVRDVKKHLFKYDITSFSPFS